MLFKDILKEKEKILRPEIDRLLAIAWKKQAHAGDLLLLHINGFYDPEVLNYTLPEKMNPHVIGPGSEGHSDIAHYSFIHKYRTTNIYKQTHVEYLKEIVWSEEKKKHIDELVEHEETTIQLEMLIYLKIWEADMFIKKMYEFVRILLGEPYDWYFKISESSRDKTSTGTRQKIVLKEIKEKIKEVSPIIYNLINETYKTQVRNSIAHSNYSFLSRNIHLNNYIANDEHSQLRNVTFDEWINIFHNTIALHNQYIYMNNQINNFYAQIATQNKTVIEVKVTKIDLPEAYYHLTYRPEWNDWRP